MKLLVTNNYYSEKGNPSALASATAKSVSCDGFMISYLRLQAGLHTADDQLFKAIDHHFWQVQDLLPLSCPSFSDIQSIQVLI